MGKVQQLDLDEPDKARRCISPKFDRWFFVALTGGTWTDSCLVRWWPMQRSLVSKHTPGNVAVIDTIWSRDMSESGCRT